jgi:hypothetical protein
MRSECNTSKSSQLKSIRFFFSFATLTNISNNSNNSKKKKFSGYIEIEPGSALFFWFFESRNNPETSPVTLWLNGGPGLSSMFGVFRELGPCKMNRDGTTSNNRNSFTRSSNMLFVDQVSCSWSRRIARIAEMWNHVTLTFKKIFFFLAGRSRIFWRK